jgi:hypothetical protein
MAKAIVKILYHEVEGAGDDQESQDGNGVVVTLSHIAPDNFRLPAMFIVRSAVMVDHKITVDSISTIRGYSFDGVNAQYIRSAIKIFDELVEKHPAFGMVKETA